MVVAKRRFVWRISTILGFHTHAACCSIHLGSAARSAAGQDWNFMCQVSIRVTMPLRVVCSLEAWPNVTSSEGWVGVALWEVCVSIIIYVAINALFAGGGWQICLGCTRPQDRIQAIHWVKTRGRGGSKSTCRRTCALGEQKARE